MVAKITLLPNFNKESNWNNFNFELCYSKLRKDFSGLNSGCFSTAKLIISLYAKYSKGQSLQKLHTSIRSMATERNTTERTIHNHLKILIKSSFLKSYERNTKGIIIILNDEFVQFSEFNDRKNFPTLKKQELNNHNSTVNKCITSTVDKNTANELSGGVLEPSKEQFSPPGAIAFPPMVENFWNVARFTLYANESFSQSENQTIKKIIWANFYKGISTTTTNSIVKDYHEILLERIKLVKKYLLRDPENRYVTEPALFFSNSSMKYGFKNTSYWYIKTMITKKLSVDFNKVIKNKGGKAFRKMGYLEAKKILKNLSKESLEEKYRMYLGQLNPLFENELRY